LRVKFVHYVEYYALRFCSRVVSRLSVTGLQLLGNWLGAFGYYFVPIRRSVAREQIQTAFPEYESGDVDKLLKESYAGVCKTFLEVMKMPHLDGKSSKVGGD
jgi:lauroyl/myristoyl acyltransferase